ncbi:MAG: amino acid ABC transporter substrate-binding protein [Armatimonadetes bacterium]|nr:amino acid ABC transporter substrate-binding protein [Anaerolineae bacterium]
MKYARLWLLAALIVLAVMPAAAQAEGKLGEILARGTLNCGVSGGLPGFSAVNPDTSLFEGLDADFCRVLASAIWGPDFSEDKINFVPLTSDVRFTALQAGEVDILHRNTTWTLTRELTLGSDFGPSTFYDGQGILARIADGYTSLADMDGVTFCSTSGTTTEKNITDAYRAIFGTDPTLQLATTPEANVADLEAAACDALTSDKSQLASLRTTLSDPSGWTILGDTLSKEPLGPMYLSGDAVFADIVNWSVYATFQAEEYGVTSENIDALIEEQTALLADGVDGNEDAGLVRFFGLSADNYGAALGIPNTFAADIVRNVGNYAEIYDRNVVPLGVAREGSLNALWSNGGLLYSPAWR